MTKKRHHTIPRFLLNNFASHSHGDKFWIWQLGGDGKGVEISTKDAGVAKLFYGDPDSELEEKLASLETAASRMLRDILSTGITNGHEALLNEFAYTLMSRTQCFREQATSLSKKGLALLASTMSIELVDAAIKKSVNDSFGSHLQEAIKSLPVKQRAQARLLASIPSLRNWVKKQLLLSLDSQEAYRYMQNVIICAFRKKIIDEAMTKAHIKALSKFVGERKGLATFKPVKWILHRIADPVIILGDAAVITRAKNGEFGGLHRFGSDWSEVYLPVSPNHVLVAYNDSNIGAVEADTVNRAIACFSMAWIYSSENSQYVQSIASFISSRAPFLTDDEIRTIVDRAWAELAQNDI